MAIAFKSVWSGLLRAIFVVSLGALVQAGIANAALSPPSPLPSGPCGDPWVSAAVQRVMNRPATGSGKNVLECDIYRYGNGQWSNYDDLVNKVNAAYGICRDKWVAAAVWEVKGRRPQGSGDTGECDYKLYGGGSWSGYADLVQKVRTAALPPASPPSPAPVARAPAPVAPPTTMPVAPPPAPTPVRTATASPPPTVVPPAAPTPVRTATATPPTTLAPPKPLPSGPCGDPWVSAAVQHVMNRPATGSGKSQLECDIHRYGNGQWSNYQDLVNKVTAAYSICRDKWVSAAVWEVKRRAPQGSGDTGECDYRRYGGGTWSGYADLVQKVHTALANPPTTTASAATPPSTPGTSTPPSGAKSAPAPIAPPPAAAPAATSAPATGTGAFRQDSGIYIGGDPNYGRATPAPTTPSQATAGRCTNAMIAAAIANAKNHSLTGSGNSGACDPMRYKGGQWQSQAELNQLVIQSLQCSGTIEHAWVGQAYAELGYKYPRRIKYSNSTSSAPYDIDECDLKLYGTSFGGYNDLKNKIAQYESRLNEGSTVAKGGASGGASAGGATSPGGAAPGATPPKPPGPPAGDGPLGQLDAFDNGGALLRDGLAAVDIADSLAQAMQSVASGSDALVDADVANEAAAAVRAARYLLDGPNNPYSLSKLISGSVVAMDEEDRRLLNRMIAEDGLLENVRATKAMLLAAQQANQGASLALASTFLERSSAQFGGPALRQYSEARQKLTFDGNDRAQQLVSMLSFGRAMATGSTFMGASTQVEQTASSFVELATEKLEKSLPAAIGLSGLEEEVLKLRLTKFATVYTVAKLTVLMSTAALNAMAASLPTSISAFYMTLDNRQYVHNAPPWPLKTSDANGVVGRVYVVPHRAGGQVITPLSIIGTVVDVGGVTGAMKYFGKLKLDDKVKQAVQAALAKAKTTWSRIGHAQVDNMLNIAAGKSWFPQWASSAQNYFSIPAKDLNPVEINDVRVVKLTPGPGGGDGRILVGTQGTRFKVTGVGAGATGIRGELTPAVQTLYAGGGEKFFNIAINVTDDKPQSGGPWAPCGKPGDGGLTNPSTGKCEYPN